MLETTNQRKLLRGDLDPDAELALRQSGRIAWDIETEGLHFRNSRIGTCQLYAEGVGAFIVRVADERPSRLCSVLSSPRVKKVFHYAPFDLRFMRHHWNVRPTNVACTKVLSRILFPQAASDAHSLKRLLMSQLAVDIDKQARTSNWLSEELTDEQRAYAFNDVIYLLDLYSALMSQAQVRGLADIVEASFKYLPVRVETDLLGVGDVFSYSSTESS